MTGLPAGLQAAVQQALAGLGDQTALRSTRSVGGGCINNATRLETAQSRYLLKWNSAALPGMFQAEANGLALLADTRTVRVPEVYAVSENGADHPAFILMEFLEGSRSGDHERLGQELAELHHQGQSPEKPPAYGLDHDNYIGSTPQQNGWDSDWPRFYASRRIRPQMELASRNGLLTSERTRRLERLIEHLPGLLDSSARQPSLIHGDLWSGNVIPGPDRLCLIDPAVYYADREAEIAFTELFGGFSARFYAAYQATWPLDPGYAQRRDLYNLYHLLNHLNLFGESYGYQIDAILRHYAG